MISKAIIFDLPSIGQIKLDIPLPGGFFEGGVLMGIGTILQIVFSFIIVLWVVLVIFAAIKIIRSQGNPEDIQEGIKRIKNALISVSVLFGFFIVLSLVGAIVGFGTPAEWGNTLAQCGGYDGPFYFVQVDRQFDYYQNILGYTVPRTNTAYCCTYQHSSINDSLNAVPKAPYSTKNLNAMGVIEGRTWFLTVDNNLPMATNGVYDCYLPGE